MSEKFIYTAQGRMFTKGEANAAIVYMALFFLALVCGGIALWRMNVEASLAFIAAAIALHAHVNVLFLRGEMRREINISVSPPDS